MWRLLLNWPRALQAGFPGIVCGSCLPRWLCIASAHIFRCQASIRLSLRNCSSQNQTGILGMFNMFSGGALSRFTIFALGIMPYISASIIMQLLTVVSPQLEAIKKEGESGRRKITQYTRYGTLLLGTFQALGIAVALESQAGLVLDPGYAFRFTTVVTLITGTMFLMWLGEQITERGLGNGISIIIFAGIAAGLPNALGGLFELVRTGVDERDFCDSDLRDRCCSDVPGGVYRARSAQDSGELCEAPGRQQDLWRSEQPSAAEAEYGRRDSAYFCFVASSCSRRR